MSRRSTFSSNFNPLPLYRGRRTSALPACILYAFQSSPSIQRETSKAKSPERNLDISILSLYTEGDVSVWKIQRMKMISILSLYTEGDRSVRTKSSAKKIFQSSPSIQRETSLLAEKSRLEKISILSLYTEGDVILLENFSVLKISILSLYTEGD